MAALIEAREFEGAYCVYRPWFAPLDVAGPAFHGFLSDQQIGPEDVTFRMLQLFQPNDIWAYAFTQTLQCHFRYRSAQCGMRRGTLFVPPTTATIFSANTIGASGLAMTPNLYAGEVVMILAGTGAGQEGVVASNTATTLTMAANWGTNPSGTSLFIVTGPGTMRLPVQLADIYSSTTIGKSGLGRVVDADKNELVAIVSGTGAGQERRISTNSSDTYTVSVPWVTAPDGTSRFMVIYRRCDLDRASCTTRGVLERFSGILQLTGLVTEAAPYVPPPFNTPPPPGIFFPNGWPPRLP